MADPRPVSWGVPSRRVCWLVGPSAYDVEHLPEDFTIMYELSNPFGSDGYGRPGRVLVRSMNREEVALHSRGLYERNIAHCLRTLWYDLDGNHVNKIEHTKARSSENRD